MASFLNPVTSLSVSRHQIGAYKLTPNTSIQRKPLLIYHNAFQSHAGVSQIENHLNTTGVVSPRWRYTMFTTSHFHSTAHEVLCVHRGSARLCFGGEGNSERVETEVGPGDVVIVPAGVAHRLMEDQKGDFEMIGAYPKGTTWDMCYGAKGEEAKVRAIERLEWFERDPLYGDQGPVLEV